MTYRSAFGAILEFIRDGTQRINYKASFNLATPDRIDEGINPLDANPFKGSNLSALADAAESHIAKPNAEPIKMSILYEGVLANVWPVCARLQNVPDWPWKGMVAESAAAVGWLIRMTEEAHWRLAKLAIQSKDVLSMEGRVTPIHLTESQMILSGIVAYRTPYTPQATDMSVEAERYAPPRGYESEAYAIRRHSYEGVREDFENLYHSPDVRVLPRTKSEFDAWFRRESYHSDQRAALVGGIAEAAISMDMVARATFDEIYSV